MYHSHQERLGAASLVRGLDPEVVRMVLDLSEIFERPRAVAPPMPESKHYQVVIPGPPTPAMFLVSPALNPHPKPLNIKP